MSTSNLLHKPVLAQEVLGFLKDHFSEDQEIYALDGTFGRGGHYKIFREHFKNLKLLAVDQDQEAIDYAQQEFSEDLESGRLSVLKANFREQEKIKNALSGQPLHFVFLDIGVSSPQLDQAERGFSFYQEGPLDMRMDQFSPTTAADLVNDLSLEELRELFLEYGEVYAPTRLLLAIENYRKDKKIESTMELSQLIESVCGWRKKGSHPATQYFQALRLKVNQELESLKEALEFYTEFLSDNGLFLLITFHSLEDRIAKRFFKSSELGKPVNKKVVQASREEILANKRSRSAKLRVFLKGEGNEKK